MFFSTYKITVSAPPYVYKYIGKTDRHVHGNYGQISQVVSDLIENACEAFESLKRKEKGVLAVVVRPMGDQRSLLVTVADTAGGMAGDVAAHVFDPFYTTKPGKGSGLGLAICHGIIGEHGGDVWVKSRVGKGSAFSFTLPCLLEEPERQEGKGRRKKQTA